MCQVVFPEGTTFLPHLTIDLCQRKTKYGITDRKILIFKDETDLMQAVRKANRTEIEEIVQKIDILTNFVNQQSKTLKIIDTRFTINTVHVVNHDMSLGICWTPSSDPMR